MLGGWVVELGATIGSSCVTKISGTPMSRSVCSRPCSAAWSTTGSLDEGGAVVLRW